MKGSGALFLSLLAACGSSSKPELECGCASPPIVERLYTCRDNVDEDMRVELVRVTPWQSKSEVADTEIYGWLELQVVGWEPSELFVKVDSVADAVIRNTYGNEEWVLSMSIVGSEGDSDGDSWLTRMKDGAIEKRELTCEAAMIE